MTGDNGRNTKANAGIDYRPLLRLGLALSIGLSAATASAEKFRAATWNAANSANDRFLTDFANLTRDASHGAMDFEVFPSGALLPAEGTLEGLQTGLAHMANITAAYVPAKMPVDFVTADLSFLADDQLALAFAKAEVSFFNEQMQRELKGLDLVFASGFSLGIYNFMCGFDAVRIEDFQGKKIRTSSDAQVGFVKSIGGVAVSVAATDIYTGIERGTLDCTTGTPLFLTSYFNLSEVARSVYRIPLGSNANGGYYFNKQFWQDRSPEERRVLLDALSRATAREMVQWAENVDKAWKVAKESGVALNDPEPAALQKLDAYIEELLANLPTDAMEKRGIDDPTDLINDLIAGMDKWKGLLSGIDRNDIDAVTMLLDQQIYGKLDVNSYGVK